MPNGAHSSWGAHCSPLLTAPLASALGELETAAYTGVWFGPWPLSWLSKHWREEQKVF